MIKKLLTLVAIGSFAIASAQTGKIAKSKAGIKADYNLENTSTNLFRLPVQCYTVSTITSTNVGLSSAQSDTPTGCSPNAGFVFGSNCYDDKEKANFFPTSSYSSVTSPSVTGVRALFFKNGTEGTAGTTMTVGIILYNGTNPTTAPGTVISSTFATLTQILAAQSSTVPFFYYNFTFATPVTMPTGGFYASLVIPTTAGDTAVIAAETSTASAFVNNAWEKWSDNSWHSIPSAWGGLKANLAIEPIVCGNSISVGISKNLGLSKNVQVMPNPSTGLVNVALTLAETENINVTVTNALGQQILANKYDGISTQILSLDLTNQSNGIYFVTISNGKDKMVQRLILNK